MGLEVSVNHYYKRYILKPIKSFIPKNNQVHKTNSPEYFSDTVS